MKGHRDSHLSFWYTMEEKGGSVIFELVSWTAALSWLFDDLFMFCVWRGLSALSLPNRVLDTPSLQSVGVAALVLPEDRLGRSSTDWSVGTIEPPSWKVMDRLVAAEEESELAIVVVQ